MPASTEIVNNRPLSGSELRDIMLKDCADMLAKDGMFAPHIGYGRAAYKIVFQLHIDNPSYPEHVNTVRSRQAASNEVDEGKKHIEPGPLKDPSEEAVIAAATREREIESPNHARIEHNLPVTIMRRDPTDGLLKEEQVFYDNKDLAPGPVKDTDISERIEKEWGE